MFEEIAVLSKAMSDSNRVKIVTLIQREEGICVCEICDTLHLSQPLVSRHLKQLKNAQMVTSTRVIYTITKSPTELIKAYIKECKNMKHS